MQAKWKITTWEISKVAFWHTSRSRLIGRNWWFWKKPFDCSCGKSQSSLGLGFGCLLLGLLGQENGLDVWQNSSLGDGNSRQKLVQLLVVTDGELKMTWDDPSLLVVSGCVAGQLEDFSRQVLEHCCQVNWSSWSDSLGVISLSQESVDTSNWKLKSSSGCPRSCLGFRLSSFATSRHVDMRMILRNTKRFECNLFRLYNDGCEQVAPSRLNF